MVQRTRWLGVGGYPIGDSLFKHICKLDTSISSWMNKQNCEIQHSSSENIKMLLQQFFPISRY